MRHRGRLPHLRRATLALSFSAAAIATAAAHPLPRLEWNAQRRDGRLEVAPVLTCPRDCVLRFELATVGQPAQRLRQAGQLVLRAGESRVLGHLSLSAPGPRCRLGITLWHQDGFEEHYETDPCAPAAAPAP